MQKRTTNKTIPSTERPSMNGMTASLQKLKKRVPLSFWLVVVLPVLVAGFYYAFIASGQYLVETKYIIQGHERAQSDVLGALAGFAGGNTSPSAKDAYIAREYIWSAEFLNKLDKELGIKQHYSDTHYDWWARLDKDALFSDFKAYWNDTIDIEYDTTSGITTLGVTAFSAEKSFAISESLLKAAEKHVNKLSERARSDSLDFAKKELHSAEENLIKARINITALRNVQRDIDPEKTTEARLGLVTELESKLAAAQAELKNMSAFMKSDAFKIRALRGKVTTLKQQIRKEKKRWGDSSNSSNTLSTRIAEYESLLAKKVVAERLYESALVSLESARLNAIQKQQYLEVIAAPYLPSEAEKPYVFANMLSIILGSLLLWVIGVLIVSAVKDHA